MISSRRCLLTSLLATPALAGCERLAGGSHALRFWNGFTGPDGITMLRIVKEFNRSRAGAEALMQRMDWSTYYAKLFVAGLGGRAPEVFVLHTTSIVRFARARFVRPIDDLVARALLPNPALLDRNVWTGAAVDGRHYGFPLDCHAMGMFLNTSLCRNSGLVVPSGSIAAPRTQKEFLDAAGRITVRSLKPARAKWGFVFSNASNTFYTLLRQFGGRAFHPDGSSALASPESVAALQFCVDLIRRYRVAPAPQDVDAWVTFRQAEQA